MQEEQTAYEIPAIGAMQPPRFKVPKKNQCISPYSFNRIAALGTKFLSGNSLYSEMKGFFTISPVVQVCVASETASLD